MSRNTQTATETAPVIALPASSVQRIARHPTDPMLLGWSLLFGCCVAHPSVMLRRSAVMDVGGYDPSAEPAEDYDLWLRLEATSPGCLANTGEVSTVVGKSVRFFRFLPDGEREEAAGADGFIAAEVHPG